MRNCANPVTMRSYTTIDGDYKHIKTQDIVAEKFLENL